MRDILEIIESIDSGQIHINPTQIYNEGWMTRLLVKKSIESKKQINGIDFSKIQNWTSEGLISSPFVNAPYKREGYTHADIALGDFSIDYAKRGEINIKDARVFGVIEAKMNSNLSQRTTHAIKYNQAARNIVCILSNTKDSTETFFCIAAPSITIKNFSFKSQIDLDLITDQIKARFEVYDQNFRESNNETDILARIEKVKPNLISYEDWIENFEGDDFKMINDFYQECRKWNRLKSK
jgi:hypothetical protein